MISIYKRLYYGYYIYLKEKGKTVNNADIGIFVGLSHLVLYALLLLILNFLDIFVLNKENHIYVLIAVVCFESILMKVLFGKDNLARIKEDYDSLTERKKNFYKKAILFLTPISVLLTTLIIFFTYR
ncbi:hypothetical protein Kkor_1180 [Kangiella koreensis DSM 16069]|uniref:Uncharacterized protein n=1 Tax=Kangiella koreensis (strain DSM 16069 / JCM 12317 / KCTC 12182 / SW-125) TaxID=523791 RepID=C7RBF7_KANKD|nr:hypothetical protein Kkor_1180 [Kangiella koreensis DSM 16069]